MKKILTYGTFDLFHEGHFNLLKRAKALGDYLIVGVTTEQFDIQRGKMNVMESLIERIDNVRDSGFADEIVVEDHEGQKIEDVLKHKVDIIVFGSDWRGQFDYLSEFCNVKYIDRTKEVSSSKLRENKVGIVRLGIVGTGRIANRACVEVKYVSGVITTAVYNPNIMSAKKFSEVHDIKWHTDDFEAFLETVDAVYIATPHNTHYYYIERSLTSGKHVLCEKPMVLNKQQAIDLFDMAESMSLVLMEAIKTAYAPGFSKLLSIAKSGRIGRIIDVEAAFTKLIPETPFAREYDSDIGGSFTELSSYSLLPIVKLLGREKKQLQFDMFKGSSDVDTYAKAYLRFDYGIASAKTGIGAKSEGQLLITGTNGYILVKSPWWLLKTFEICYEDTNRNEIFSESFLGDGLRYEFADFIRSINYQNSQNHKLTKEESIFIADIIEKFLNYRKNLVKKQNQSCIS